MSWIESHQSLSRHRKTLRAAALLKADRHKFIGHLHELWWWGLDNADTQGHLWESTPEEIAIAAEWPIKDAATFVDALVSVGFMEHSEDGYTLHDWYNYAGKLNDRRDKDRERARISRAVAAPGPAAVSRKSGVRPADVRRMSEGHPRPVRQTTGVRSPEIQPASEGTVPYRTGPNLPETFTPPVGPPPAASAEPHTPPPVGAPPPQAETTSKRVTTVDEAYVERLATEFGPILGPDVVREKVQLALGYASAKKHSDLRLYVRNWVRTDAERASARASNGHGPPGSFRRGGITVDPQALADLA